MGCLKAPLLMISGDEALRLLYTMIIVTFTNAKLNIISFVPLLLKCRLILNMWLPQV